MAAFLRRHWFGISSYDGLADEEITWRELAWCLRVNSPPMRWWRGWRKR